MIFFAKPVSTFTDHALARHRRTKELWRKICLFPNADGTNCPDRRPSALLQSKALTAIRISRWSGNFVEHHIAALPASRALLLE
jgi:hypothetical protein